MDCYKTISNISKGYRTEQRSKFISFAIPIQTIAEAKSIIDNYRKKYCDAQHVCWAYMLGADRTCFRINDDGEPSSTAGKPILGVINSNELTNILIVVIRYFGGIKLGTSGLAIAYRAAALNAIENAIVIKKTLDTDIAITFGYSSLNSVMKIIKEKQIDIVSQKVDTNCEMVIRVRKSELETFNLLLKKVKSVIISHKQSFNLIQ